MWRKKYNKIVLLANKKLKSIENIISKALIDNEINHDDFTIIMNGEKKYRKLKESTRMMKSQRGIIEKHELIDDGKKWGLMKSWKKIKERTTIYEKLYIYIYIKWRKWAKLILLKIQSMMNTKKVFFWMFYKFFDVTSASHKLTRVNSNFYYEIQELVDGMHKPIIRKM